MKKSNSLAHVSPIKGAAEYFAGLDPENNNKPSVYMNAEGYLSVIDTAYTIDKAREKAIKWQKKENIGVQVEALRKEFPGKSHTWYLKQLKK